MTPRAFASEGWSRRLASLLLVALTAGPARGSQGGTGPGDLVVRDATLVTLTEEGVLDGWSLWIRDGAIVEMATAVGEDWPADAEVIDGGGKYLVPALYDLHAHIFDERDLEVYALMGVGTVRNMDGWGWHLDLARRPPTPDAWRARLVTTGEQVQAPRVSSPAEARELVAREARLGFPWIKAYDGLDLETLAALGEAASRHGMRVTGHLPDGVSAEDALATGAFDDVAHAEELLPWYRGLQAEDAAQPVRMARHLDRLARAFLASDTALVATLVSNRMILEQIEDLDRNLARPEVALAAPMLQVFWRSPYNPYAGEHRPSSVERQREDQRILRELVLGLESRGVEILAGTDAPNPTVVPAVSLYTELELLVEAGLTPESALRAATRRAAAHLGEPERGCVWVGAPADLLLLDADPLRDISNLRLRAGVILGGRYLARETLETRLAAQRAVYASERDLLARFDPASPAGVLEALGDPSTGSTPGLSSAALTSLVWVYSKFGNADAAETVARRLVELYPSPASERVLAAALAGTP